jgi:hypothetical protein
VSSRKLWLGVAVASAAVLIFGSVQTTGALWRDQEAVQAGVVRTADLVLTTGGSGTGTNFTFDALSGTNVVPGTSVTKPLDVRNPASAPLHFRMTAAGPQVSTTGASVKVTLAASAVPDTVTCPDAGPLPGQAIFTQFESSATTTSAPNQSWTDIAPGGTQKLCVRTTLTDVTSATSPVSYTHKFSFEAEST